MEVKMFNEMMSYRNKTVDCAGGSRFLDALLKSGRDCGRQLLRDAIQHGELSLRARPRRI